MTKGAGEFDFIARFFRPLAGPEACALRNDAAIISPNGHEDIILSTDTLVEGVHFLSNDPPETVGRKLLRVNLSDCAAMGATPYGYLLNISRPASLGEDWFSAFAKGLGEDQSFYGLSLFGGDTTSTRGPLVMTLTILGRVPKGEALHRNNAQNGDELWVTGTIGDAALGLKALTGQLTDPDGFLTERYRLPRPRLGIPLFGIVTAALDVSDGLVQDAGHIAEESGVSIIIEAEKVPRSPQARQLGNAYLSDCLSGGDDYELLLTCPPAQRGRLLEAARQHDIPITRIGHVEAGEGKVTVLDVDGAPFPLLKAGWRHF
ncbi:thiamine-phosphate kinase [Kozakia baliensis]|uniref:Thiamine-monophosphate kinase n=1 Tax=Kozakia baliensis TaxID=153496 RepID=A0A1D8UTK9_9PROT|nr:thiamine-phosphate kinase [Kozakia baliensis]AOX16982.1 thiamine-phosphate kinase [Kozakia baliensis]GBR25350.1 thiamine monophosphate kinase [Kozakia baliensis NRIC 0488]GEL63963.1 thiamine-monophosphate kinase [Kozakia baliensis]